MTTTPPRPANPPELRPLPPTASGTLLALSIELQRVRGCLLENISGVYRLAGWLAIPRLGERHLADQVAGICRQLGNRLGRKLWDDDAHAPLLRSAFPMRHPPIEQLAVTLSARPYLQVWIVGLTGSNSLEAARIGVDSSAAQLSGVTVLGVDSRAEALSQTLVEARPDVLVLAGGYDLPEATPPVQVLTTLAAGALARMPRRARPAVIYAGSQPAAAQAEATLRTVEGLNVATVPNILPAPERPRPALLGQALDEHYWRLCRRLDGFALLEEWATSPARMTTVEANFVRLVRTWRTLHALPSLCGLYCGERWVHVWSVANHPVPAVVYAEPDPAQTVLPGWPAPQLLSGPWPDRTPLPDEVRWWDRSGLAPVVAALGPVAPGAMYSALSHDLLLHLG